MKRFLLSVVITSLILVVCVFALYKTVIISNELTQTLDQLSIALEQNEKDQISDLVKQFELDWEKNEKTLMHFIHHDELDTITGIGARLDSLAKFEDYSELSAEIHRLRHLIEHVCKSQMPVFKNIF